METQATPHAPAAHPMGKHGHPGARGKAGHSSDAACSMRRMALRQAQEMLGKKIMHSSRARPTFTTPGAGFSNNLH